MKNACPVCRNVNELTATMCRFCGTPLTPPQPAVAAAPRRTRWPLILGAIVVLLLVPIGAVVALSGNQSGVTATTNVREVGTDEGAALKFDPLQITAPANTEGFQIIFNNRATVPHNLAFEGEINAATNVNIAPGASETITFTTPGPGSYTYVCTIHPGMAGQMVVGEAE